MANTAAGIAGGTGVMPGGIEGFFCPNSKLSSTERGLLEARDDTFMLSRDFFIGIGYVLNLPSREYAVSRQVHNGHRAHKLCYMNYVIVFFHQVMSKEIPL